MIFATAFIVGSYFHEEGWIDNLEDIFIPVFAIMFAAFGAAQSQSFVAEMMNGQRAAGNIFNLVDEGS